MLHRSSLLLLPLLLCACIPSGSDFGTTSSSSSVSSSSASIVATANVTFSGRLSFRENPVDGADVDLLQDGGSAILLRSPSVDLRGYVGTKVRVTGRLQPASDGQHVLLDVSELVMLEASSSSLQESSSSEGVSTLSAASAQSSIASSLKPASSAPASSISKTSSVAATSSAAAAPQTHDVQIAAMAKEDLSAGRWTQQYCSSHIGFCFPVHKNWWFLSFGASTGELWHVEISNQELANPGDGVIVVRLVSGALGANLSTGSVEEKGTNVVAYAAFNATSHVEITAPGALRDAASYIATHVATFAPQN